MKVKVACIQQKDRLEELLSRADMRVYRDLRLDLIKKLYQ